MAIQKALIGAIPLLFVSVGLASAVSGMLAPSGGSRPVAGTLLVLVGITVFASLWLVGWWTGEDRQRDLS